MSAAEGARQLQIELLQARAAIERAELANALHAIDAGTRKARSVGAAISGMGANLRGAAPMLLQVLRVLREHPYLLSTAAALLARRPLKRLLLAAAAAGVIYFAFQALRLRARFGR